MTPGAAKAPRVEARDLCKSYGGGAVLADCSLQVGSGEFVAVVGRSGSGKSTLLAILGLLDRPDSGRLKLCGEEVLGLGESRRARLRLNRLGFVFQSYNLVDELTVEQNVELPLVYKRIRARDRRREVGSLLEQLDLQGFEGEVSAGAVRWRAAAGRHRPGRGGAAGGDPRRRADGQPRRRARARGSWRS